MKVGAVIGRGVWWAVPGTLVEEAEISGEGVVKMEDCSVLCRLEGSCEREGSKVIDGLHIFSLVNCTLAPSTDGAAPSVFGTSRIRPPLPRAVLDSCRRVFLGLTPLTGEGVPCEVCELETRVTCEGVPCEVCELETCVTCEDELERGGGGRETRGLGGTILRLSASSGRSSSLCV